MLLPKLALRNILSAGLRTWLNVFTLSFAFVTIIFLQGIYSGMNEQAEQSSIDAFYGGGQYWHNKYDPYDPLSLDDAHGIIPTELQKSIEENNATPILIKQATIYPKGRFQAVFLKGIDPNQNFLSIPSLLLSKANKSTSNDDLISALIGSRMAESIGLNKNNELTIQWRDVHGTFNAMDVRIVEIFQTIVQEIDNGQLWISLDRLQEITGMHNEATIIVLKRTVKENPVVPGWEFKNIDFLLKDIHSMISAKTVGGSIMYGLLLFLAMLAIFDTQVLSVWRRKKEIGTLMALGMTRIKVIGLFTLEGAFHGVLAAAVGAVYGAPLLMYFAKKGFPLPEATDKFGFALGEKLIPTYTIALIVGTAILVLIVTTIVSYIPTRKIAKLNPTDALRGKVT